MDSLRIETMSMRASDPATKERKHAEQVASQFEAIFVRTMVQSLRQSASLGEGGGMFGEGPGADTYGDWFDQNLSEQLTKTSSIGIEEALMRDFERNGAIPLAKRIDAAQNQIATALAASDRTRQRTTNLVHLGGIDGQR